MLKVTKPARGVLETIPSSDLSESFPNNITAVLKA